MIDTTRAAIAKTGLACVMLILGACGGPSEKDSFDYVGELSTSHTTSGGTVLQLRIEGAIYELALHKGTVYTDISMTAIGAVWVIGGEYGINGARTDSRLLVNEIRYFGDQAAQHGASAQPLAVRLQNFDTTEESDRVRQGGVSGGNAQQPVSAKKEKPFFQVDKSATGPLTLEELQVNPPTNVAMWISDEAEACALQEIERLANEAGDPETLNPQDVEYLSRVDLEQWRSFSPHMRRVLLAQAITSRAYAAC